MLKAYIVQEAGASGALADEPLDPCGRKYTEEGKLCDESLQQLHEENPWYPGHVEDLKTIIECCQVIQNAIEGRRDLNTVTIDYDGDGTTSKDILSAREVMQAAIDAE